jgi:agmatine/peptidylarginine deiminase
MNKEFDNTRNFYETDPPVPPVRNVAEFDPMQAVLVRYPFGIPMTLVKEMADDIEVITIVTNQNQEQTVLAQYAANNVNTANCSFIYAPSDSYWTRDYGPWFIANGDNEIAVVDFPYNRPRPLDNAINGHVANFMNVPLYGMNVVHTGGNYMTDGFGISASTDLVWEENGNNQSWVLQQMQDYLGVDTYHVTIDPLGDYIKHIDCWAKFLDVDKVVITSVPTSNPRYVYYEQVANYYANQISAYGTPYQVFRVYSPNGQPYTNSLILNNRVYVPIMNSSHDAAALAVYQQAMPGYEVLGFTGSWQSTDALHCRAIGLADKGMLRISHLPITGTHEYQPHFQIEADIIPYSGATLYSDSLFLIYKANQGTFDTVMMSHVSNHTYTAMLPVSSGDTLITYYLSAADQSGRKETFPLIGPAGARNFEVVQTIFPGDANCDGIVNVIDVITSVNFIMGSNPQPFCFENADVNSDGLVNVIDVVGIVNLILTK